MMRKVFFIFLIVPVCVCALFGVFFIGLLAHEYTHVIQSPKATSICYDFNQITWMHVNHDTQEICGREYYKNSAICQQKFSSFEIWTERWAHVIGLITEGLGFVLIGLLLGYLIAITCTSKTTCRR